MTATHHKESVPKPALYAGIGIVLLSLTAAALGSYVDVGSVREPSAVVVVEQRDLRFEAPQGLDALAGDVAVLDAASGAVAVNLSSEGDGFIRGVLRALARDRALRGLPTDAADTRLTLWADGRLSLRDLATEAEVELTSFGADNRRAFERLLNRETKG